MDSKEEIRKSIQKKRLLLPDPERRKKSARILQNLFSLPEFRDSRSILFYLSKKYEARTDEMVLQALSESRAVFLPKTSLAKKSLEIYEISSLEQMERGPFDVLEPKVSGPPANPQAVDCALVPGLAFDLRGNRIGHGLGFYDKFLPRLKSGAHIIGLCFEFQIPAIRIPSLPHDVRMHYIITERRIIKCLP